MEKLRPKEILKRVEREGFEQVWSESSNLFPKPRRRLKLTSGKRGVSHPLFDLIQKMRQSFLEVGFKEVSNPIIVDEIDVYKQYGSEAPVILDRCYYLATLPRPDIGLSRAKSKEIECLGVQLTEAKVIALKKTLREYKKGEVDSDDLVERVAEALNVSDSIASLVLSEVFPEFASLEPKPLALMLRSHMTSAWFRTLQAMFHKFELPLKLFSVDVRFRREQREDPTHLRTHYAASCVVMDNEMDSRDGEEITKATLTPLGFDHFRFVQKKVTSRYYVPGTEYEGYIFHAGMNKWIEVVNYGLYSPIALAKYDLTYPVLNVGIGVERLGLAVYGETDMRRLVYPQFYTELKLSDGVIAGMVDFEKKPQSKFGAIMYERIKSTAKKHGDVLAPCEFMAYEGEVFKKRIKVFVYEVDKGTKLLGPAALNYICVYNANVVGIPEGGMEQVALVKEAREKGVSTGLTYLDAVAALAASKIEKAAKLQEKKVNVRVRMAKNPSDINIKISRVARRYITTHKKKIDITGPVFIGVRAEIED